jgi:hypothetical protein
MISIENTFEFLAALIILVLIALFPALVALILDNRRRQRKQDQDTDTYAERTTPTPVPVPPQIRMLVTHKHILALLDEDEDDDDMPVEGSGRNDIRLTSEYINLYLNMLDHAEAVAKKLSGE